MEQLEQLEFRLEIRYYFRDGNCNIREQAEVSVEEKDAAFEFLREKLLKSFAKEIIPEKSFRVVIHEREEISETGVYSLLSALTYS